MDNSINSVSTGLGTIASDTYDYVNHLFSNPVVVIIMLIVLILYVSMFVSLGGESNTTVDTSTSSSFISTIFVVLIVLLIFVNGLQYLFGYDIISTLKNLLTTNPELDVAVIDVSRLKEVQVPEIKLFKQVFNIPGNEYVYEDAKALCSAYGARLATYKEVEDSYNKGGEWCNYGWSDGQMALFPTQQKTFDQLQKIEGHENDCGRPGVNGGYIANPKVKFGVNCYGYKPRMTPEEEDLMANKPLYPKTMKDIAMENRVNYWKDKLSEILVSPFNHTSWSRL